MDYANWMADHMRLIGAHPLSNVVFPGSHDAAMSVASSCSIGANACNTRTQTKSVGQQIASGSRYFDLRPILSGGQLRMGHFSGGTLDLGCYGQSVADATSEAAAYFEEGKDLVILKFSHYANHDDPDAGWGEAQMERLVREVTSALGDALYTGPVPAGGLQSLTVSDFIGQGGRALAVFDGLPDALRTAYPGAYSYADKGGTADLVVYDRYADTNDLDHMEQDQLAKMADPANHGANLFLLSWTLTLDADQAVKCAIPFGSWTSILDLAGEANGALRSSLGGALADGRLTLATMPNVLYADAIGTMHTDVALWLNEQLLG